MTKEPYNSMRDMDTRRLLPKKASLLYLLLLPLLLLSFSVFFTGCLLDDTVDESDVNTCQERLDNRKFSSVANDAGCSNYERGSAELAMAGFLFEKFLDDKAADNFPDTLGLGLSSCQDSGIDDLMGAYSSSHQMHYLRAQYWTRDYYSRTGTYKPRESLEVSFFATLGEVIAQSYCEMDANLDGTIADEEINDYSKVLETPTGNNTLATATNNLTTYQVEYDTGDVFLIRLDSGIFQDCIQFPSSSPNYEGVWDATADPCTSIPPVSAATQNINLIVMVDELQQLFQDGTATTDVKQPLNFISMVADRAAKIDKDMTDLGFADDSDMRKNIAESVEKMDNGGTCVSPATTTIDVMTTILKNAAKETTRSDLPATGFKDYNLLTSADILVIAPALDGQLTCPVEICGTLTPQMRLIYKSTTNYTGLFKEATSTSNIAATLENLGALVLDSNNNVIQSVADDKTITLKELLCSDL